VQIRFQNTTSYPDVNQILGELIPRIQAVLVIDLIGIYLDGSLVIGDFDEASDIDFIAVARSDVTTEQFRVLQEVHDHVSRLNLRLAIQIEGFYVPLRALCRLDTIELTCPNLERGLGERLKYVRLGAGWEVHKWVLREYGHALVGPAPSELIDEVTPGDLRRAMQQILNGWITQLLVDPAPLCQIGYQSYTILSLSRILYTLINGTVVSKVVAASWARDNVEARWVPVINAALKTRLDSERGSTPEEILAATEFAGYVLTESKKIRVNTLA